jgi:coenzyme PQQ synthesis protein D (PqqD)
MNERKPVGRPDVTARRAGEEWALADSRNDRVHYLNETAEFIWELCDGEHSVSEIEAEVRASFEVPAGVDLRSDIERTLALLGRKGLLLPTEH